MRIDASAEVTDDRTRLGWSTAAAALWLSGAVVYVSTEAIAASVFPGYSYAVNYISDLGIPTVGEYDGRSIDSPLAWVMNAGFIVHGALFLLAAIAAVAGIRRASRRIGVVFLAAAATHFLGSVLIGVVPGSQESTASGVIGLHVIGAALAIIGGNIASILGGRTLRGGLPRWHRTFSLLMGLLGIASVILLQVQSMTSVDLLPDGVWERASVYAITVWEVTTAILLLRRRANRAERGR